MHGKHWNDDDFLGKLYGVGPPGNHLDTCGSCARRWEEIQNRRASLRTAEIEVPREFLARQRRAIQARLHFKPNPFRRVLVPAIVTMLLAMILIVYRPAPEDPPALEQVTDDQLFDDVFRIVSRTEPDPVVPIRSLFEEQK